MNHERALHLLQEIIRFKEQLEKEQSDFDKLKLRKKIAWREEELKEIVNG